MIQAAGLGLDEQALIAVLRCHFEPAKENGRPVRVQLAMEIKFEALSF